MSFHGLPCWYELNAADLAGDTAFYAGILPWRWSDAGMPGMTYLLGATDAGMVAGAMAAQAGQPTGWTCYVAVDSADDTAKLAQNLGAQTMVPPTDIPGTGRFALMLDPQGAVFGLLQPLPGGSGGAFDQTKIGHGNWNELISSNAEAGLVFYGKLFGWTISRTMAMGPDMTYHIIARDGLEIGGGYTATGRSCWKPYFGIASCATASAAVTAAGGKLLRGPDEVPGGAYTLQIADPSGTLLALVGPA